jgi:hypothetical protein
MSANPPERHRPAGGQEPAPRGDVGEARLWHIGVALAVSFTGAVLGLAALAWLPWVVLGVAGFRRHGAPSLHDTVGVLQLVFASVAGAGALVALVVAYRRQKVAEAAAVLDRERAVLDKERWQATAAHDRTRLLNERFTAIAAQIGSGCWWPRAWSMSSRAAAPTWPSGRPCVTRASGPRIPVGDAGGCWGVNVQARWQAPALACGPAIPDKDEVDGSSPSRPTTQTPSSVAMPTHLAVPQD